jgi:hypothetical protein
MLRHSLALAVWAVMVDCGRRQRAGSSFLKRLWVSKRTGASVKQPSAIVVIMVLGSAASALAETPEGRQACMNDAFQFCQDAIHDRERVFNCLAVHKDAISPACRAEVAPKAPARPAERTSLPPKSHERTKGIQTKRLSAHSAKREAAAGEKAKTKKATSHTTAPKATTKLKTTSVTRPTPQRSGKPLNLLSH